MSLPNKDVPESNKEVEQPNAAEDDYGDYDDYSEHNANMDPIDTTEIAVGHEARDNFLNLASPAIEFEKKKRQLGARTGRLDRLEYSGSIVFSGQTDKLAPTAIRQKLLDTFQSLVY